MARTVGWMSLGVGVLVGCGVSIPWDRLLLSPLMGKLHKLTRPVWFRGRRRENGCTPVVGSSRPPISSRTPMSAVTEANPQLPETERTQLRIPIFGPIVSPEVPVEKLDGPLARLLKDGQTRGDQELELTVRCETVYLDETQRFIEELLKGKVLDSVRWGRRGRILHTTLAFGKIQSLAQHNRVSKVGLLRYFDVKR